MNFRQKKVTTNLCDLYLVGSNKGLSGVYWQEQDIEYLKEEHNTEMSKILFETNMDSRQMEGIIYVCDEYEQRSISGSLYFSHIIVIFHRDDFITNNLSILPESVNVYRCAGDYSNFRVSGLRNESTKPSEQNTWSDGIRYIRPIKIDIFKNIINNSFKGAIHAYF